MLLAQCGRGLLRQAVEAPPETRPLPLRRRPPGRHQPLPRRDQRRTEALHMDRRPRQNHRRRQTRAPSVRFHPLDARRTVYLNFELSALFLHPHFPACTRVRPRCQPHREPPTAVGARRLAPLRTVAIAVASPNRPGGVARATPMPRSS